MEQLKLNISIILNKPVCRQTIVDKLAFIAFRYVCSLTPDYDDNN
jgi:hypothetical protein